MKRYHTHVVSEEPEGGFVRYEEVRASVERLLVVAEKMPHAKCCPAATLQPVPLHDYAMEWKYGSCDPLVCPRGELLAGLKEMAK